MCKWGLGAMMVAAGLSACVDRTGPSVPGAAVRVPLQAAAAFSSPPAEAELFELRRARLSVLDTEGDSVLALSVQDIDPQATHWMFQIQIEVAFGRTIPIKLQVELASVDSSDVAFVQWSGESPVFRVGAGLELLVLREIHPIELYRGPTDNLSSISISLNAPDELTFGQTAVLTSVIEGGGPDKRPFFESLDPDVVRVDGLTGRVEPVDTGTARVVAFAGPASDTASLVVRPPTLDVEAEVLADLSREVDYFGSPAFVLGMQDEEGVEAIGLTLRRLGLALSTSDVMASARAFLAANEALDGYAQDSDRIRFEDGPQLSLIDLSLLLVGDALGIPLEREGGDL